MPTLSERDRRLMARGAASEREPLTRALVDDAGALQVLVNEVEGCHDTAEDPGGCEVCTAVQIAKDWLQKGLP